ncbi:MULTISPECIES: chemotaxis response regulator protein-glutamate methylesterase [Rhodopseudomonas]|uniref:Protein-glutamate methylesterase/protein-glutamine glutaminase n=1 Tax=Rhodopseudomonas palustris TaxID=1076 RepID=A0A0D7F3A5_RHOPL|nr:MULTISPECIES: chemotaxis response regulator protein-glutamate methylesterase [Rhodopseudomonas]KIZ47554.1 chemotaxis protein [Rhodopseudomonas palustris]MDF3809603.1 chemotaxis response regulator protein-glutamate methylesterase [Rhodopseudomonas sp. BAL398]WOK17798.1 chemotaxis response regulator protein-glutamate methylesterase [Rhodopseudomonas sp. BAL398]
MQPIRVLIVDDSAFVRQVLTELLSSDPTILVVGAAPDPIVAREMIKALNPDLITLDIEMPRMDGLAFLERIMALRPMPVVMISSLTQKGADAALRALAMGAVDYIAKPMIGLSEGFQALKDEIIAVVKVAAKAKVRVASPDRAPMARLGTGQHYSSSEKVIAVGASTGGVEALQELLTAFPADSPAILVTQHMPAAFTAGFANRLDQFCAVTVSQAKDGERVLPGHVYIAPGGFHMELARSGANYVCRIGSQPPVSGHRPSVDVLFRSVAKAAGANAVGIMLTGMGSDGAQGMLEMRRAGASTIGQDEASCVVYGMPKAAFDCGAVEIELPIRKIAQQVLQNCEALAGRGVRV